MATIYIGTPEYFEIADFLIYLARKLKSFYYYTKKVFKINVTEINVTEIMYNLNQSYKQYEKYNSRC